MKRIDDGSHDYQSHKESHHRRTHTQRRTRMSRQSVSSYYRIGYQRIRSHDCRKQKRCQRDIAQKTDTHKIGHCKGDKEGQHTENHHPITVFLQSLHIHFQTCKEHDIVQSYTSKKFKRGITLKNIQSIFSNKDTCQHHTNDMWNAQSSHDDRRKQYHQQNNKENQCRVGYREILR